jgi:DNA-binding transcriptional LysR family regulator
MVRVPIASRMRFVVVGSADYFSRRALPRTLEDLSAHACIRARHPDGTSTPWEFRVDGASRTLDVPGNLTLDTPVLMVDAVERGWGLAQVAEWYVERSVAEGHLVQVLDAWAPPVPELSLYYADRRHMPAGLRAFIDLAHRMNLALRSRR